jgi:hypothetical protein
LKKQFFEFFKNRFRNKRQNIPCFLKDVPFWRFSAQKEKKLTPNIISKQIFDFLIFKPTNIRLINK